MVSTELLILIDLTVVIVIAKVIEEIVVRLHQPPILGDLLAGIIIGPTVLGLVTVTHSIEVIGWLGIVILIFLAGLETDIEAAKKYGIDSLVVALGGVLATFILAFIISYIFSYSFMTCLFIAAILSPTSVSVTSTTLLELGVIKSRVGKIIMSAAFIDDVIAMVLFALVTSLAYYGEIRHESLIQIMAGLVIVFGIFFVLYKHADRLLNKIIIGSHLADTPFTHLMIIGLLMAIASAYFGLSPLVGAYLAGLAISHAKKSSRIMHFFEVLVQLISPFFFVYAGILLDPWGVASKINTSSGFAIVSVLLAGVIGKVAGCGLVARLRGMSIRESIAVGVGMMPRAGVDLVIAVVGLSLGVLTMELYLSALILIYTTSLTTPLLLKKFLT